MIYLILILLILVVLVIVDVSAGNKVQAVAEVNPGGINAGFSFLKPFMDVEVEFSESRQHLTLKIFRLPVYKTNLVINGKGNENGSGLRFIRSVALRHIHLETVYGMPNPFSTGIAYAVLSRVAAVAPQYGDIESQSIQPDFLSGEEYLRLQAHADFSLCHTIINYLTRRNTNGNRNPKPQSIRGYPVCEYEELFPGGRADW